MYPVRAYFLSICVLLLSACELIPVKPTAHLDKSDTSEPKASKQDSEARNVSLSPDNLSEFDAAEFVTRAIEPDVRGNEEDAAAVNAWQRVQNNLRLNYDSNTRIERQVKRYLKSPSHLETLLNRAPPYLFHLSESLEAKNLPGELALVPMVESGWDPYAFSHGGAAGLWQFIPSTGKSFGLEQNWWYDGRRDIYASTQAAVDYFQYLYERMGQDWLLAFAAYNAGEGNVRKAIKKNKRKGKATDYWSLDLPEETEIYVPKILALAEILKRSEELNVSFPEIADEPHFTKIDVEHQIDLNKAAALAGIDAAKLYGLNPGFNRWSTPPSGPHHLLIPTEQAQTFIENLANTPKSELIEWTSYKIKKGDSLISIAKKHRIDVASIKKANNISGHMIRQGQRILIPSASEFSMVNNPLNKDVRRGKTYTVKSGDSLWSIGRKVGVSTKTLARWNKIAVNSPLQIGQKLVISRQKSVGNSVSTVRKVSYKVKVGDSIARIASRFQVRVNDILEWNTLSKSEYIHPGDQITLYVDVTQIQR